MTPRPPKSFQRRPKFFCTRLSDQPASEPRRFPRVVLPDRHGARDEPVMSQISRGIFAAARRFADVGRGAVGGRPRSHRQACRIPWQRLQTAINRAAKADRAAVVTVRRADPDHFGSAGWSFRYLGPGPRSRGASGPQRRFRALMVEVGEWQADGRLRARRQRVDRSRQAASARPLRDLSAWPLVHGFSNRGRKSAIGYSGLKI